MSNTLKITTPNSKQFVEIVSRRPLTAKLDSSGFYFYDGFYEVRLVSGPRTLRLRVDESVTEDLKGSLDLGFHWDLATMRILGVDPSPTRLDNDHPLDFRLHLSSPVIPRERGMWIRLDLKFDAGKGGMHFGSGEAAVFDGAAWVETGGKTPQWLTSEAEVPWQIEDGSDRRGLSEGNVLLAAPWNSAQGVVANLVHIDPSLRGRHSEDYQLSLRPVPRDGVTDVCVELYVRPGFGSPPLVSDFALLLAESSRSSFPLGARGLRLRSASDLEVGVDRGWTLEWLRIPGASGASGMRHTFSLESFTQLHLASHALGLATTRARNRMSVVPSRISTVDENATFDAVFYVERTGFVAKQTRLQHVLFPQDTAVRMTCGGALDVTGQPLTWLAVVKASDQLVPPERPLFLKWTLIPAPNALYGSFWHRFGAGSVLLEIEAKTFLGGEFALSVSPEGEHYRRGPLESALRLEFESSRLRPLSMDPEIGFETLSSVVERPRPWTVDLSEPQVGKLTVRENARRDQSRVLRLSLRMPDEDSRVTDAVLVDTSPFTVVRVQTREKLSRRELYAEYVDDADQAPEWRFFSETGRMVAVLPPQGIGEEMVKGHLLLDGDVVPKGLFDFRLTPTARLELDRTDIDTARSEAPWSLRRLLARRSGTTGVKLERARFELLYGLEARLEASGLRVAELEGLVGRVPYPDGLWDAYRRRHDDKEDDLQEAYAAKVAAWQAALWRRPSWWRVYRDATDRRKLVLDSDVEFRLRPTRQTANPFAIAKHATREGEAADLKGRRPLRGGVDWPFQSPNIYNELLERPVSSSGSVEGLTFGSLGGEGSQTAAFNNGKTLIISTTKQGRLDSLTLIRVGRIAMTWNKARHVIVYERTTRRAPRYRYDGEDLGAPNIPDHDDLEVQPSFAGLAALRKIREYVEITEPRRRYPDSVTERPASGPLVQCTFGTTVIPVMSSWGRDVKQGFAISLRGPIPQGKEEYFPDPHAFLDLARAQNKGGGFVSQRISSTHRLVFFSSTRDEDGGDTDQWPAWPDMDFPAISPPAAPSLPYRSGFHGRRQPDAEAIDPVMERFTFELERAEEGINLMHGRNSPGVEAKISNICVARGMPQRQVKPYTPDTQAAQQAVDDFSASRALIVDGLRDLAWAVRDRAASNGGQPVGSDAQFHRELGALLQQLKATKMPNLSTVDVVDWAKQQTARGDAFLTGMDAEAKALTGQLASQLRRIQASATDDFEQLRLETATLANAVALQAKEQVGTLSLVGAEALQAGQGFIDDWLSASGLKLQRLSAGADAALHALEQQLNSEPGRASELESIWREGVARLPQEVLALADTLERLSEGPAGKFFSRLASSGKEADTFQARFRQSIEPVLRGMAQWIERWLQALPPFEVGKPEFAILRRELTGVLDQQGLRAALAKLTDDFQKLMDGLGGWDARLQELRDELERDARDLQKRIGAATDIDALARIVEIEVNTLAGRLKKKAGDLVDQMTVPSHVLEPLSVLQGRFNALATYKQEIEGAVQGVEAAMQGTLAELDATVHQQVAQVEKFLQAGSRQLEDWARSKIVEVLEIGRCNAGVSLEAVRVLAEGPITEGLEATRNQLGYYYQTALDTIGLTPACAIFNDLGKEVLNALSASVPFDRLGERLLPKLDGMMVRDLFPDFCGIKLTDLLPDLDIKLDDTHNYDWLTVQHGFDKDRLSAWARINIDKKFEEEGTLFDLGPVKLRLLEPLFFAQADLIYEDGRQRQIVSGRLEADFELSLNDNPMVTMTQGKLVFDERGKLDFQFDSENIELAKELRFVSDALSSLMPQVEGLTLTPLAPAGINAELSLPLPDIGTGAFTLTGVTLNAHLGLVVGDGFEIRTGLWLSKPERPFGLAVLFLGGGGWFGIDATYKPPTQFVTRVSVGVSAGAFAALNFGFASGSAGLLFTAGVDFYRDWKSGSGTTGISLGILLWGEFSIMGIASAGIRLTLRITYTDQGGMRGTGTLSVRIKICWCYTLNVRRSVEKVFSGGSGNGQRQLAPGNRVALAAAAVLHNEATTGSPASLDISKAVSRYFETLAT